MAIARIGLGLGLFASVLAGWAALSRESLVLAVTGAQLPRTALAEHGQKLEPYMIVSLPDQNRFGPPPYPAVLQFHGCAGARLNFQKDWATHINAAGFAAIIVDSNRPRAISRATALDTVCKAKRLLGQERAGDVAAAIYFAIEQAAIDADRLVLMGWSHGGWSLLDFLSLAPGEPPKGLRDTPPTEAFSIGGLVLVYPYCGLGNRSRFQRWSVTPPTLALYAGADSIVEPDECRALFDLQMGTGKILTEITYDGAEHAFDDPFIEEAWRHWHHPAHARAARKAVAIFLEALPRDKMAGENKAM